MKTKQSKNVEVIDLDGDQPTNIRSQKHWTTQELKTLKCAHHLFKRDYVRISEHIKTKTPQQVKDLIEKAVKIHKNRKVEER